MNVKEYVDLIDKTAVYPRSVDNFGIAYCFLGLLDESMEVEEAWEKYELGEVGEDVLLKEFGDVYWYTTALCKLLEIDPAAVIFNLNSFERYDDLPSGNPFGMIKKFYRDDKPIDKQVMEKFLFFMLDDVIDIKIRQMRLNLTSRGEPIDNITKGNILQMNYDKLIKRRKEGTIQGDGDNR